MIDKKEIILASTSPRRIELINKIPWLSAAVFAPNCAENYSEGLCPEEACVYLAKQKAVNVFLRTGGVVVGADTMVVTEDGEVLGKPKNIACAEYMFKKLCGHKNYVITGCYIASNSKNIEFFEKTYVTFGAFNDKIVYNYIKSDLPYDKAGGFGLQDSEIQALILSVEGDKSNVYGLPIGRLDKALKEMF